MNTLTSLFLSSLAIAAPGAKNGLPELQGELAAPLQTIVTSGALPAESAADLGLEVQSIVTRAREFIGPRLEDLRRGRPAEKPTAPLAPEAAVETIAEEPQEDASPAPSSQDDVQATPKAVENVPEKSNFSEVWSVVKKDPIAAPYPKAAVSFWSFFKGMGFHLLGSARRTLDDHRDILPHFDKLIRPNGIALAGTWEITEPTEYTGYFAPGSRAQVIARASVFSDETDRGEYRSFGMAVKIYPTADAGDAEKYKTANVFLIDDNGGTQTPHYTDAVLTTHPKMSLHGGLMLKAPVLAAVALAQRIADRNPGYRQLYPVSELGVPRERRREVRTPAKMMLRGSPTMTRVDAADFREELDAAKYPAPGLQFDVMVSDGDDQPWRRIGHVRFTDSVVSKAVDHNLHFPHPRYKKADTDYR